MRFLVLSVVEQIVNKYVEEKGICHICFEVGSKSFMIEYKYFFLSLVVSALLIALCKPLGLLAKFGTAEIVVWVLFLKLGDSSLQLSRANRRLVAANDVVDTNFERRALLTSGIIYPLFVSAVVVA